MGDTSQSQIGYVAETTAGTTPASALTLLNFTGESFAQRTNSVNSNSVRSDRQVVDVARVGISVEGSIETELQYGNLDDLLEGAFMNDWTTAVAVSATDIAADATGFTSSSTDFTAQNLNVGQWFKVGGFTDTSINTWYKATSISSNDLNTSPVPAGTESAGNTITMDSEWLKNGTTEKFFTIEKQFTDISEFHTYTGCEVNTLELNASTDSIMTANLSFLGLQGASNSSSQGTGSANAASSNGIMNSVDHIELIREGGSIATFNIQSLSVTLNNNLDPRAAIGNLANVDIGMGQVNVTGEMVIYFENQTEYEKYLAFTDSSVSFKVEDTAGNAYMIDVPAMNYTDGEVLIGGNNAPTLLRLPFNAKRDTVSDSMINISRVPA